MSYYDDLRAGDEEMIREWGRPVKLRGKTDPIIAIFNEPYARVDVVQVPKQRSIEPDGSVTWSGWTDYVVKEPQPDGTGLTNIFLEPHTSSENSEYSKY